MPFIPHSENDIADMLSIIGAAKIDDLFDEMRSTIPLADLSSMQNGLSEQAVIRLLSDRAPKHKMGSCFMGAGSYDHFIPSAVWDLVTRGEFYTAYTPYQPEASQGMLEVIFEYQSMMTELMAMEVSNASLYDGASALVEAVLMALRIQKNNSKKILVPHNLHPHYRTVLESILHFHKIELINWCFDTTSGCVDVLQLKKINHDEFAAVIMSQPNFFGCVENVDELTNTAHEKNAMMIGVVNPIAMALLKPPGKWGKCGADIVCGEGQSLGVPMTGGGPYFGFLCCRKKDIRQLPGRIVGRTIDVNGKNGFVLTLQAREQHIRRAKATSNICTNQGLLVTAATIYMRLLGGAGLQAVAKKCVAQTEKLKKLIADITGANILFCAPSFHEFVVQFDKPVQAIASEMKKYDFQPGLILDHDYSELKNCLLICVTETKTDEDLERFVKVIRNL